MKYLVYFVLCWCVVLAVAGEALAYDGEELLGYCQNALNRPDDNPTTKQTLEWIMASGLCRGYTSGVIDASLIQQAVAKEQLFCLPEGIKAEQVVQVVTEFLEAHPYALHRNASILTLAALREAFPCPKAE